MEGREEGRIKGRKEERKEGRREREIMNKSHKSLLSLTVYA
jgi:predicted transposase YdaD